MTSEEIVKPLRKTRLKLLKNDTATYIGGSPELKTDHTIISNPGREQKQRISQRPIRKNLKLELYSLVVTFDSSSNIKLFPNPVNLTSQYKLPAWEITLKLFLIMPGPPVPLWFTEENPTVLAWLSPPKYGPSLTCSAPLQQTLYTDHTTRQESLLWQWLPDLYPAPGEGAVDTWESGYPLAPPFHLEMVPTRLQSDSH